jgi:hypothetical protein
MEKIIFKVGYFKRLFFKNYFSWVPIQLRWSDFTQGYQGSKPNKNSEITHATKAFKTLNTGHRR